MRIALLSMSVLLAGGVLCAQETASSVQGRVRDPQGRDVVRANVILANDETGISRSTVTLADGSFLLPEVEPGHYHLEISSPGFVPCGAPV
jgi:hypothetical protein